MDPLTVFGAASSIIAIVEAIAKTVTCLKELHAKWKEADLTLLNLVTQLTSLKSALNKISEWVDSDLAQAPQHHQLVIDLVNCVVYCRMLVTSMESLISKLHRNINNDLEIGSKIRMVLASKECQDFQEFIKNQTSALTLLLVACNCKTLSEQNSLLEMKSSRAVIDQVQDDSSSLYVLFDTDSILSRWSHSTENSSKLSVKFLFDQDLLGSKAYQSAFRSFVRRRLGRGKVGDAESTKSLSTVLSAPSSLNSKAYQKAVQSVYERTIGRNKNEESVTVKSLMATRGITSDEARKQIRIDSELATEGQKMKRECTVLMLGGDRSDREIILRQMSLIHHSYKTPELETFRGVVVAFVIFTLRESIEHFMCSAVELGSDILYEARIILQESSQTDMISERLATSIYQIWKVSKFREWFAESCTQHSSLLVMESATYFFDNILRIAAPDFLPSADDILHIPTSKEGLRETKFVTGLLTINIVNIGNQFSERKKWIHAFENITSIMFVADISSYDDTALDGSSALSQSLINFDSVVNSRWFFRTSIILVLNHIDRLKEKLGTSPLETYFPDYSGGSDMNRASKYILWRFNTLNRSHLNLYPHLTCATDLNLIRHIFSSVKETILHNCLKDSGIL